jgi:hypothetical protein
MLLKRSEYSMRSDIPCVTGSGESGSLLITSSQETNYRSKKVKEAGRTSGNPLSLSTCGDPPAWVVLVHLILFNKMLKQRWSRFQDSNGTSQITKLDSTGN